MQESKVQGRYGIVVWKKQIGASYKQQTENISFLTDEWRTRKEDKIFIKNGTHFKY